MTLEKSKSLYMTVLGVNESYHSASEWEDIHNELEKVVAARTDRSATRPIMWWGCWDRNFTAIGFVRKIRELNRKATNE